MTELPPPADQLLTGAALAAAGGVLGRLMWHAREVQRGKRRFWSAQLLWEFPIALGCGFVAAGAGEYFGLSGMAHVAAIVAGSYLGPGFVEAVIWRLVDRVAPKAGGTP